MTNETKSEYSPVFIFPYFKRLDKVNNLDGHCKVSVGGALPNESISFYENNAIDWWVRQSFTKRLEWVRIHVTKDRSDALADKITGASANLAFLLAQTQFHIGLRKQFFLGAEAIWATGEISRDGLRGVDHLSEKLKLFKSFVQSHPRSFFIIPLAGFAADDLPSGFRVYHYENEWMAPADAKLPVILTVAPQDLVSLILAITGNPSGMRKILLAPKSGIMKKDGLQPHNAIKNGKKVNIAIVRLGNISYSDVERAAENANSVQDELVFKISRERIEVSDKESIMKNGCYDLIGPVQNMIKSGLIQRKRGERLFIVTDLPFSDDGIEPVLVNATITPALYNHCFKEFQNKVNLISTYVWRKLLLPSSGLPGLDLSGKRTLVPYLLLMFGIASMDSFYPTPAHDETRGCPSDYCENLIDIDYFFKSEGSPYCKACTGIIETAIQKRKLSLEQFGAINKILEHARGKA